MRRFRACESQGQRSGAVWSAGGGAGLSQSCTQCFPCASALEAFITQVGCPSAVMLRTGACRESEKRRFCCLSRVPASWKRAPERAGCRQLPPCIQGPQVAHCRPRQGRGASSLLQKHCPQSACCPRWRAERRFKRWRHRYATVVPVLLRQTAVEFSASEWVRLRMAAPMPGGQRRCLWLSRRFSAGRCCDRCTQAPIRGGRRCAGEVGPPAADTPSPLSPSMSKKNRI